MDEEDIEAKLAEKKEKRKMHNTNKISVMVKKEPEMKLKIQEI